MEPSNTIIIVLLLIIIVCIVTYIVLKHMLSSDARAIVAARAERDRQLAQRQNAQRQAPLPAHWVAGRGWVGHDTDPRTPDGRQNRNNNRVSQMPALFGGDAAAESTAELLATPARTVASSSSGGGAKGKRGKSVTMGNSFEMGGYLGGRRGRAREDVEAARGWEDDTGAVAGGSATSKAKAEVGENEGSVRGVKKPKGNWI